MCALVFCDYLSPRRSGRRGDHVGSEKDTTPSPVVHFCAIIPDFRFSYMGASETPRCTLLRCTGCTLVRCAGCTLVYNGVLLHSCGVYNGNPQIPTAG